MPIFSTDKINSVLILVLVEDGLGEVNLYFAHSETYKTEFLVYMVIEKCTI